MRFYSVALFFLCLSLLLSLFPAVKVEANEPRGVSAEAAVLYHPASGTVLYEKNANDRRPIASTTKITTALTILEEEEDLDRTVKIPQEACGIEGSSLYLRAGESLTLRDLLYGLMLASANDAAAALAISNAGSIPAFAAKMNGIAQKLGLRNTHFQNPHGLDDPEHFSSAKDLALISAAALDCDEFREIVSTKRYSIPSPDGGRRYLQNHNRLLQMTPDCIGVKTGFTKKSGRCLVSAAERDEVTLISVTLNDPNDWKDHLSLFEYGFSSIQKRVLLPSGAFSLDCPVVNGEKDTLEVCNSEEIGAALPSGSPLPERALKLPRFLTAPIVKGQIVGYVEYDLNGKKIGESPLVATDSVGEIKYKRGLFHR